MSDVWLFWVDVAIGAVRGVVLRRTVINRISARFAASSRALQQDPSSARWCFLSVHTRSILHNEPDVRSPADRDVAVSLRQRFGIDPVEPMNKVPDPEKQIRASWSDNAAAWSSAVRSGQIESRVLATNSAILQAILEQAPRTVLDVGCGEGWLAHYLAELDIRVAGFDASEELIARAQETNGARFLVLDYDSFAKDPQQVGSNFDVVVCNFSLLGRELETLLRSLQDVLAPEGTLIIQTLHPCSGLAAAPYEDGWREEDFAGMTNEFRTKMPWYFRTIGSWIRELRQSDFLIRECREPIHPESRKPLSLILIASPRTVEPLETSK
ncbi:MAG: class I SAM-dependent methyltransferase [Gemmatimonadota bacterium]